MAKYYYGSVLLPEIPSDILKDYSYFLIYKKSGESEYRLLASNDKWYSSGTYLYTTTQAYMIYYAYESSTTWSYRGGPYTDGNINKVSSVYWANHNVPLNSATSTDIYMVGSIPIPEEGFPEGEKIYFKIEQDTLISFGDQARRINGTTDKLTTAQILEIFEGAGQGGSDITEIDGMYTVRFWQDGTEVSRCYTAYTNGVQAPVHAGGSSLQYCETDGGIDKVEFPYYPTKNTDLYAILTKVVLPSPYESYFISYGNDSTVKWSIRFFKSSKLSCGAVGSYLNINGSVMNGSSSERFFHIYGFETLEDAVNGLLAYCEDGTIVTGKSENVGYWCLYQYYFNYNYYLSHHIYTDTTYSTVLMEKNPYVG